ncbi:hypothetical protein AKJ09_01464 [Labilithrix luteola]|uniref:Uncharacterized protein n=1 Tax=Labilithrix luteola TaxID=1391654 RepID=A0A0K1PMP1_9BACT|nr:hypothetical protein AKJ09_01464 [Labilithrix luteola]
MTADQVEHTLSLLFTLDSAHGRWPPRDTSDVGRPRLYLPRKRSGKNRSRSRKAGIGRRSS